MRQKPSPSAAPLREVEAELTASATNVSAFAHKIKASARKIVASAPGKINLQLLVSAPDERGYHPLQSIFETVNLREICEAQFQPLAASDSAAEFFLQGAVENQRYSKTNAYTTANTSVFSAPLSTDAVSATATSGQLISVRTIVDFNDPVANRETVERLNEVPAEKHLAWRAAAKLIDLAVEKGKHQPFKHQCLTLTITKRIPMAGGMAGGSADAAATLVAVNELLNLQLRATELEVIARSLGADVPACLTGGISLGLGYGDHMTRLDTHPQFKQNPAEAIEHHWVMIMFTQGLSTPTVFQAFDRENKGRKNIPPAETAETLLTTTPEIWKTLQSAAEMAEIMENDLQETAFKLRPDVAEVYRQVQQLHPVKVMLSGSGPTLAVLVENEAQADALEKKLSENPLIQAILRTSGPAEPARIETAEPACSETREPAQVAAEAAHAHTN